MKDFQSRFRDGEEAAANHLGQLQRKYESAFLAQARKSKAVYKGQGLRAAVEPTGGVSPDIPPGIIDEKAFKESVKARTHPTRKRMVNEVGIGLLGKKLYEDRKNQELFAVLIEQVALIQAENAFLAASDAVHSAILEGLTDGLSVDQTAERIGETMSEWAPWQAKRQAQTDLISLANGSSLTAAQVLGEDGPKYKTWLSAGDDKVRPAHQQLNKQTVPIKEPWRIENATLQYPGDPEGPDGLIINCRCTLIYTDTANPALAHSANGGIQEDGETVIALAASTYDEALHPRYGKGDERGGQFAPKDGTSSAAAQKQAVAASEVKQGVEEEDHFRPELAGTRDAFALQEYWSLQQVEALAYAHERGWELSSTFPQDPPLYKAVVASRLAEELKDNPEWAPLRDRIVGEYERNNGEAALSEMFPTAITPDEKAASLLVSSWARTSSDTDPESIQLQLAAVQEFGLEGVSASSIQASYDEMNSLYDNPRNSPIWTEEQAAGGRAFLRAQHDLTQRSLAAAGIEDVELYRGMRFKAGEQLFESGEPRFERVATHPISSFSSDPSQALIFTSGGEYHSLMGTVVHRSRILSTPFTGVGCFNENEFTVLGGGDTDAWVATWNDEHLAPWDEETGYDVVVPAGGRSYDDDGYMEWMAKENPGFNPDDIFKKGQTPEEMFVRNFQEAARGLTRG